MTRVRRLLIRIIFVIIFSIVSVPIGLISRSSGNSHNLICHTNIKITGNSLFQEEIDQKKTKL